MTSLFGGQTDSQPTLICTTCATTTDENATLKQALASMGQENTDLAAELAGARGTLKTVERQVAYWKGEADKAREDDPESQQITTVYETWKRVTGHKRSKLTEERRRLIKGQMRSYQAQDLIRAIQGAALLPYVRYGKRYVFGAKDEISTQLEHCIGTKPAGRVEQNIDYYRRACKAAAEQRDGMWDTYQRIAAHQDLWASLMFAAAAAARKGVEVEDLEQRLWERMSADDTFWADLLQADADEEPAPLSNVVPIRQGEAA